MVLSKGNGIILWENCIRREIAPKIVKTNMATFREPINVHLLAHSADIIPGEEFVLLYDLHMSKNLDYPFGRTMNLIWRTELTLSADLNLDV